MDDLEFLIHYHFIEDEEWRREQPDFDHKFQDLQIRVRDMAVRPKQYISEGLSYLQLAQQLRNLKLLSSEACSHYLQVYNATLKYLEENEDGN